MLEKGEKEKKRAVWRAASEKKNEKILRNTATAFWIGKFGIWGGVLRERGRGKRGVRGKNFFRSTTFAKRGGKQKGEGMVGGKKKATREYMSGQQRKKTKKNKEHRGGGVFSFFFLHIWCLGTKNEKRGRSLCEKRGGGGGILSGAGKDKGGVEKKRFVFFPLFSLCP